MNYVVNIGNTNTTLAYFKNGTIQKVSFSTHAYTNENELRELLTQYSIQLPASFTIASVVKNKSQLFEKIGDIKLLELEDFRDIDISCYPKDRLGIDRMIAMHGALDLINDNFILIDCGTATTINLVMDQTFIGGAIMAGLKTSLDALIKNTSLLKGYNFSDDLNLVEDNTERSIAAGAAFGLVAQITGYVSMIREQYKKELPVVITGGNVHLIKNYLPQDYYIEPDLIMNTLIKLKTN